PLPPLTHASIRRFLRPIPPPPISTLFPYTTLLRSAARHRGIQHADALGLKGLTHLLTDNRRNGRHIDVNKPRASALDDAVLAEGDRKSTRLNSSHEWISYAVFCLKKDICPWPDSLL